MTQYGTLITDIGLAKIANAQVTQQKVGLQYIALGDGNGSHYVSTQNQNALVNEVWRGPVANVTIDSVNDNRIIIDSVIPSDVGGFTIREIGIFDEENQLIAVGQYPEKYKPQLNEGITEETLIHFVIETNNADAVELSIDPTIIVASRKYVDERVATINNNLMGLEEDFTMHLGKTIADGVHGLATTSDISYYVNASSGNDNNDGLTSSTAFKTITKAISKIPTIVNHIVTINIAQGNYNELVWITGYVGRGRINLYGGANIIEAVNFKINGCIVIKNGGVSSFVRGFKINQGSMGINNSGFFLSLTHHAVIEACVDTDSATNYGVTIESAKVSIQNSTFSNKGTAINAGANSDVLSINNTGVSNTNSLIADYGGKLVKNGGQPAGYEGTTVGGQILPYTPQWIQGTLSNGWEGTFKYAKDALGIVHYQFGITTSLISNIITHIPDGYRTRGIVSFLNQNGGAKTFEATLMYNGDLRITSGTPEAHTTYDAYFTGYGGY